MNGITESWMQSVWAQCWQVTVLAAAVWLIVRFAARNRPHLASVLWLVVLIKCVTPPLWSSPSSVFSWLQPRSVSQIAVVDLSVSDNQLNGAFAGSSIESDGIVVQLSRPETVFDRGLESDVALAGADQNSWQSSHVFATVTSWTGILILTWTTGCVAFASLAALRWARCWQRLRRAGEVDAPDVVRLTESLRQRLGLKRAIRVLVSRSPVGPAVVGFFRPTVILPAIIVEASTPEELEPLLAHELIHIRRGDLWVGLLQLLTQGIWWFHPLVRLANRLLTREAERCCDEEVIAHLGCEPGRYARSLIDVLALKRTLQPVPVFPGVRPVDVTSQRLERIMKLGQGCHKRTPRWCWLVMLLAVSVTLPGAAFMAAGEEPVPQPHAPILESQPAAKLSNAIVAGSQPTLEDTPTIDGLQTRVYPLDDLIERGKIDLQESDTSVRQMIVGRLIESTMIKPKASALVGNAPVDAAKGRAAKPREPEFTWQGTDVAINATVEEHAKISDQITVLREAGFKQLVIEVRVLSGPAASVDSIATDWKSLDPGTADVDAQSPWNDAGKQDGDASSDQIRGRVDSVVEKHCPAMLAFSDSKLVDSIVEKAQADQRSNVICAPKIVLFNGQSASVEDCVHRPFVVNIKQTKEGNSPIVRTFTEGFSLNIRPRLKGASDVHVDLNLNLSAIRNVETATLPGGKNQKPLTVQIPEVAVTKIRSDVDMKLGQTLLIGVPALRKPDRAEQQPFMMLVHVSQARVKDKGSPTAQAALEKSPYHLRSAAATVQTQAYNTVLQAEEAPSVKPPEKSDIEQVKLDEPVAEQLETRVYNVADLVIPLDDAPVVISEDGASIAGTKRQPKGKVDFESLIDLIVNTIGPDSWDIKGGAGSVKPFEKNLSLVIRQRVAVHHEIQGLLRQLRFLQDLQASFQLERVDLTQAEFEAWAEKQTDRIAKRDAEAVMDTLQKMPRPAIPINSRVAEVLRKAEGVKVRHAPKLTLFNAQRFELLFANLMSNSATDIGWLQLNPVISADLRNIRVSLAAGMQEDDRINPRNSETVTVARGESLLIDLSERSWTNRQTGVPILSKVPHVNRLFQNTGSAAAPATRQFYLVTPRIILVQEDAQPPNAVSDQK